MPNFKIGARAKREAIVSAARDLRSDDARHNPQYDRALVELSAALLGIGEDDGRAELAAEILGR